VAYLLFGSLGHSLLWNDEADTAAMAERVWKHGLPVVTGEPSLAYHVRAEHIRDGGVYTAGVWGQYYLGAVGVWLAEGVQDLHPHTARLRLPFAATGFAALLLLAFGLAPLAGGRAARAVFVVGLLSLAATSVSLLLHLREVRYYAPAVFLTAAICVLYGWRQVLGRLGSGAWAGGLAAALIALFNFFPPAFATVSLALAIAITRRLFARREPRVLWRWLAETSPLWLAGCVAALIFLRFEMFEQASFIVISAASARSYLQNLQFAAAGMLRFELLAPALVAHVSIMLALHGREDTPEAIRSKLAMSGFLLGLSTLHILAVCWMPLVWERYFIVVSPLLCAALLLDGLSLLCLAREPEGPSREIARPAAGVLVVVLVLTLGFRLPELRGRVAEIGDPVEGPLDVLLPYLAERYADTAGLVIATNYEGPAFTYYLGSHVTIGYYGQNLQRDLEREPDVIVPRRWPRLETLTRLAEGGDYRRVSFDVRQSRANNPASLWLDSPGWLRHRFVNLEPRSEDEKVFLLERSTE